MSVRTQSAIKFATIIRIFAIATARPLFNAKCALLWPALLLATTGAACGDNASVSTAPSVPAGETFAASLGVNIAAMTKKSDNLYIQDLTVGSGVEAVVGKQLRVNYTGWLANGNKFDSNIGGSPISFQLGRGEVIVGWDQGLVGMKVGGKRRIVIGSELAYGPSGRGSIPPNSTLVFDVELVSVQ